MAVAGLGLGAFLGWKASGSSSGALSAAFIVAVLAILEVSLSFDNAVVNATVLREMPPDWQRRFITWGIVIAVFGMRLIFPLAVVAVAGRMGPISAVVMAAADPDGYSRVLASADVSISAFGGAFLAMLGLKYFFHREKEEHWIGFIERPLARLGRIEAAEMGIVIVVLCAVSTRLGGPQKVEFLVAGLLGLLLYVAVDGALALLGAKSSAGGTALRSGVGAFIYLEVVDASFSFDGVLGAFALSNKLFIIAIGLGVGAMFVRSLTLLLVERGTLNSYPYLEHGAFYAIIALAVIMFLKTIRPLPEVVTGLIGTGFIVIAFADSVRCNRRTRGGP